MNPSEHRLVLTEALFNPKMLQQTRDEFTQCAELAKRIAARMIRYHAPGLSVATFPTTDPSFGTPTRPVPELTVKLIRMRLKFFNVPFNRGNVF